MSRQSLQALGDAAFARCDRVSAELLALTYGSFVHQLLLDYEDANDVNRQLDAVGYNMGVRLIEDFLAKSKIAHCANFGETADVIATVAFKMFMGVTATVGNWSQDRKKFGLVFEDNPLAEFAELPEKGKDLWYSNVICGVIRGALEMVNMKVECRFVRCRLRGDEQNEIVVCLHEILVEQVGFCIMWKARHVLWLVLTFVCLFFAFCFFICDSRQRVTTNYTNEGRTELTPYQPKLHRIHKQHEALVLVDAMYGSMCALHGLSSDTKFCGSSITILAKAEEFLGRGILLGIEAFLMCVYDGANRGRLLQRYEKIVDRTGRE